MHSVIIVGIINNMVLSWSLLFMLVQECDRLEAQLAAIQHSQPHERESLKAELASVRQKLASAHDRVQTVEQDFKVCGIQVQDLVMQSVTTAGLTSWVCHQHVLLALSISG